MFSLAPIRYKGVHRDLGGPIARLEHAFDTVAGKPCFQAVAYLENDLLPPVNADKLITDQPDGAGTHVSLQVACHMAISEALERWAVYFCRDSGSTVDAGMAFDGSSNGFAAFPGFFRRQARRAAFQESIERHCLICWWEGCLGHRSLVDPVHSMTAIEVENPFSKHSVVIIWKPIDCGYAFAFSAGRNATHAINRSMVELARTSRLLELIKKQSRKADCVSRGDLFERRIAFFASEIGRAQFMERLGSKADKSPPDLKLLFDAPVKGPWDRYASVWRTIIEAPSREYLEDREDYFFW